VHLPNLRRLSDAFKLVAIADVSLGVAEGLARRHAPARPYTDWSQMLAREELDAVVVCTPHATHREITLAALSRGVHVFVEKPLCISPDDAEAICARRAETGLVVQVGYMKRFHPGYEALLDALPPAVDGLRLVDVVTYDPWMSREPFVRWSEMVRANDVAPALVEDGRQSEREQVARAVGRADTATVRAYSYTFLACLVHDVNLVHGALDRLGVAGALEPRTAADWADGEAASFTVGLPGGATWHCAWLLLPGQLEFRETASLYFADGVHQVTFPAPYDVAAPVEHRVGGAADAERSLVARELVGDAYVAELLHFRDCVVDGAECRTPPEQARRDIELLRDLFLARATAPTASPGRPAGTDAR
jgi:predicted dehydrogenase